MGRRGSGCETPCLSWRGCVAVLVSLAWASAALPQSVGFNEPDRAGGSPWTGGGARGGEEEGQSGEQREGAVPVQDPGGPQGGPQPLPSPLGWLIEPLNPARLQYAFDEWLGLDVSKWSEKPRGPEIPLAIYRETIRPLGALKYENQPSFLTASFTGQARSQQAFSYDYVFADWNAIRFEYTWANADPQTILLGYQRTLGVGARRNWVHAITVLPEYVIPERFLAGTALYTFAWKPREESPWTLVPAVGINRVDRQVSSGGQSDMLGLAGLTGEKRKPQEEEERVTGAWRPLLTANVFYSFNSSWTVGVENDFLLHDKLPEYLVMPMCTYRPTQHFFVQAGAGWYQIGSDSQFTFMCRANLLFPSPRRSR